MTWYLDGVNLSTLAWNIRNRSAGWSVPGKTGENVRVPGRDGAFWTPNKTFDEGHLTLNMWAVGTYPDGSLPITEDGRKKVRENLDKLTALFANSRRLLNLRQITGTDEPMINELINPTMTGSTGTDINLATNSMVNSYRAVTTNTEVSINLSENPFMKGRSTTAIQATEDLYPDPALNHRADDPNDSMMRGYYYPINQDPVTTNQSFTPINGFNMKTGQAGARGLISITKATNFTGDAWLGTIGREVHASRADGVSFYMQLKLNNNAISNSITVQVSPAISYDGVTWTTGTTWGNVTLTKTAYSWLIVPANYLPAMSGSSKFFVKYQIKIVGASNFAAGPAVDVNTVAIQDSPRAGNPWRDSLDPSLIIIGNQTPYVKNRAGNSHMGWSEFTRPRAEEWEVVQTSSKSTTAPYAFAWCARDRTYNNEGNLAFTVFGGTTNTFRRVLPKATMDMPDQRIWGKHWRSVPEPVTVRLTERTGSAGNYTYTTVASTTIVAGTTSFTSGKFATVKGKTYCLEVVVPASDSGLMPSITFRELHVSNGAVKTTMLKGRTSATHGTGASSKHQGSIYASTIIGTTYLPRAMVGGIPLVTSKAWNTTNIDWAKEPQGTIVRNGTISSAINTLPTSYSINEVVVRIRGALYLPPHMTSLPFKAPSGTINVTVRMMNSAGSTLRTIPMSFDVGGSLTSHNVRVVPQAGETKISTQIDYYDPVYPLSMYYINQYHVMVNPPSGFGYFTGSGSETSTTWKRTISWVGQPYFSATRMMVPLPTGWTINGFDGYDPDNYSIRFVGDKIRIPLDGDITSGNILVGFRRGDYTSNVTITGIQAQGASLVNPSITLTSSKDWGTANIPVLSTSTYVEFTLSGGGTFRTIRDVFAYQNFNPIFQAESTTQWMGFNATSIPDLNLPEHPLGLSPFLKVVRHADNISSLKTGSVRGWNWSVIGGGHLAARSASITSSPTAVAGGYASAALRVWVPDGVSNPVKLVIQGTTDAGKASNTWYDIATATTSSNGHQELTIRDASVGNNKWIRLAIQTTPTTLSSGVMGIAYGAALVPSKTPLGSNFPGYFVGVKGSDGVSRYMGHIRQCFVEVTDAIDMESSAYGTIAEFNVNMTVPGAFWEDVYDTNQTIAGSGKSGTMYFGEFTGATAPMADLQIEIAPVSGTITEFTLKDKASGNFIRYKGAAQTKIVIDTTTATVTNAKGLSVMKSVTGMGSSNIMSLTPYQREVDDALPENVNGQPIIEWSGNTALKVSITGRRKYLIG